MVDKINMWQGNLKTLTNIEWNVYSVCLNGKNLDSVYNYFY